MTVAAGASYFCRLHAEAPIAPLGDRIADVRPEARPSGTAVELGAGGEQRELASRPRENTVTTLGVEGLENGRSAPS